MPRPLWLLALVACGSDSIERTAPDAPSATRDAGATDAPADAEAPADAVFSTDAGADDCAEAALHSDFAWIEEKVLVPSCATAECHTGDDPEVGLRLDAGHAYNNLVNKGASTVSGWTRVVPGSTASSYLVVSLGRTAGPPPRDGFMPLGADPLCTPKLEAIERWIVAGAAR